MQTSPTGIAARPQPQVQAGAETLAIETENLTKRFDGVTVLDHVSLSIRNGEFFSLLGPSGCGKTTLLRIIAGLDLPDEGSVRLCGREAHAFPVRQRPVNTVFQSYALFPHLTVRENVAFGLRMKRRPDSEIADRVNKIMDMVQIAPLADRKPGQLSGGQKQRVAVARAIVNEPQILLLDEPLGALDLKLRKELQVELLNLQRQLGITFIFVTHDQEEALVLSDRIAVMRAGRIEQMGEAEELYECPRTRFVAQFLGSCNLVEATARQQTSTDTWVETPLGKLRIDLTSRRAPVPPLKDFAVAIRPEKVRLCQPSDTAGENRIPARIEQIIYSGAETQYVLRAANQMLKACSLNSKIGGEVYRVGQDVILYAPPESLIILED